MERLFEMDGLIIMKTNKPLLLVAIILTGSFCFGYGRFLQALLWIKL